MKHQGLDVFGDVSIACKSLAKKDKALARALDAIGEPFIRQRPGGFEGLFRIIVEQQVSVASAQAIWSRCCDGLPSMTPQEILQADIDGLKSFGLSGPKARYVIGLAQAVNGDALDLDALSAKSDAEASEALQSIKGIGPWTAAIYLLFCQGRVDIWPPGDVALLASYQSAQIGRSQLVMKSFDRRAQKWSPWRGLAAHILWTYYAHMRGRTPI